MVIICLTEYHGVVNRISVHIPSINCFLSLCGKCSFCMSFYAAVSVSVMVLLFNA